MCVTIANRIVVDVPINQNNSKNAGKHYGENELSDIFAHFRHSDCLSQNDGDHPVAASDRVKWVVWEGFRETGPPTIYFVT